MPIPESERTGTTWSVFAIWVGLNMMPLAAVTGAIATGTYNLPIGWSIARIAAILQPIGRLYVPVAIAPVTAASGIIFRPTHIANTDQVVPVRSDSGIGMMCCFSNLTKDFVTGDAS